MGTVNVMVNGRPFSVGCEDGQELHVETLAREFDRQVQEVGEQVGQVGDLRLFLMAALMTADDLADAKLRLAQSHSQIRSTPARQAERMAVEAVNAAASRIEALVDRLD